MKRNIFVLAVILLAVATTLQAESKTPKTETTQYWVSLHCAACQQKIMENLPFEKGVKDIAIDLEKRTVDVKYSTKKTDAASIQAAIEKLGYEVRIMKAGDVPAVSTVAAKGCCSYGGSGTHQCKGAEGQKEQHDCKQKAADHKCTEKTSTSADHKCTGKPATSSEHKCTGKTSTSADHKCTGKPTTSSEHKCTGKSDSKDHVCCQGKGEAHECCKGAKTSEQHKCTGHGEGEKAPHKCNHSK